MSKWTFRLADIADAEAFSKWASENPQVDAGDLLAGLKENNPTVLYFAADKDGAAQAFAPFYLQMTLAYLGFNPEADGRDKLNALKTLKDGISAFAVQYGIREIVTLSKPEYPIAQWAVAHGFEAEPRQTFKLDLNKVMAVA